MREYHPTDFEFKVGDYLNDTGAITVVTEKAIQVEMRKDNTWTGREYVKRWLPKSVIKVVCIISGKGVLPEGKENNHCIEYELSKWFTIQNPSWS